jgi:hypothetical protein
VSSIGEGGRVEVKAREVERRVWKILEEDEGVFRVEAETFGILLEKLDEMDVDLDRIIEVEREFFDVKVLK